MKKQHILFLFLAIGTLAVGQTTYNDTVHKNRWSAQLQLGISNYQGIREKKVVGKQTIAPLVNLGMAYNLNAAWRFDANLGYTYLYRSGHNLMGVPPRAAAGTAPMPYVERTITHLLSADINFAVNPMELYHNRRLQRFNLWLGVGAGITGGWYRRWQTWDFDTTITSLDYSEVKGKIHRLKNIYIPFTVSMEYDISPQLTIGVTGQYRILPLNRVRTPESMCYAAILLRHNIGIKNTEQNSMLMQKLLEAYRDQAQYRDVLRQAADDNNRLIDQNDELEHAKSRLQQENDSLVDIIIVLRDERSRLRQQVKAQKESKPAVPVETPAEATETTAATSTTTVTSNDVAVTPTVAATVAAIETQTPTVTTKATTETTNSEPVAPKPKANIGDSCIYFDVSSSTIDAKGMETIRAVANILKTNPKKRVFLIGYASSTGNADYNLRLSQDRIYAVRKALLRNGVRAGQFIGDRANGKENMGSTANSRKVKILIK